MNRRHTTGFWSVDECIAQAENYAPLPNEKLLLHTYCMVTLADEVKAHRSQLAAVTAEKEQWHASALQRGKVMDERAITIAQLQTELAAAREDAERYRWLRENWDFRPKFRGGDDIELNTLVDAARSAVRTEIK